MALVAAMEARGTHDDSGPRTSVILTPITLTNEIAAATLRWERERERPPAQLAGGFSVGAAVAQVASEVGAGGPCWAVESGCSSSADAVGAARRLILSGAVDVAYAGGADNQVELGGGFDLMAVLFEAMRVRVDPSECRPFDADRRGMYSAPGAAVLRLARDGDGRGEGALAAVLGAASAQGSKDFFSPEEDGAALARAIGEACEDAGLEPAEISLVVAHGTGTRANDLAEGRAIESTIGSNTPVVSLKGRLGHTSYASGALNIAAAVWCLQEGLIFATHGLRHVDPALSIDVVAHRNRRFDGGPVACLSLGLGGFNSCVIVGASDRPRRSGG
jgi:3-oxoacyl-[acyl-carrier-protein] synthase II